MVLSAIMEEGTSKSPGNICHTTDACEVRHVLDRIGDKWSMLVIVLLGPGPRRFTALRREIDGISQRMLTLTLRQLERDGIVSRTIFPVVPPRVDYALTPLGHSLLDATRAIVDWTIAHREEIASSRLVYDARHEAGSEFTTPIHAVALQEIEAASL